MSQILIKRSSVASKIPLVTDLVLGELAVNTNDGKVFMKTNNGVESIVEVGLTSFSGDLTGSGNHSVNLTLVNSGVVAGTYTKVIVDSKGRVTTGMAVTSTDVTTALGFTPIDAVTLGAANGTAMLNASGKLVSSQIPAIAITDTFVVATQAEMLAANAETGDVVVRTDLKRSFILKGTSPATLDHWEELLTPTDTILTVNGQTGVVVLSTTNISEGSNLYYTDARASAAAPVQTVAGRNGMVTLSQSDINGLLTTSSPVFASVTAATFTGALAGNATTASSAVHDIGGIAGAIRYQVSDGISGFSAAGDAGQVLTSGGANSPTWLNQNALVLQSSQITAALTYTPTNKAGDTMTGFLTLHANPSSALHASTKGYVDTAINTAMTVIDGGTF